MLEKLVGLDRLTIHQCQDLAKKVGFDKTTFDLVGPKGRLPAKWIDAYFGFFEVEGQEGFLSVAQIGYAQNLHCENVQVIDDQEQTT